MPDSSPDALTEWFQSASDRLRLGRLPSAWREDALCTTEGVPTAVFFPSRRRGDVAAASARSICLRCPVRLDCADWAIRAGVDHGVWGGASPRQRMRMRTLGTKDVLDLKTARKNTPAG